MAASARDQSSGAAPDQIWRRYVDARVIALPEFGMVRYYPSDRGMAPQGALHLGADGALAVAPSSAMSRGN